ncbi:hypothetical protein C5C27_16020, partial [Rathayibacter sp. AY2B7]
DQVERARVEHHRDSRVQLLDQGAPLLVAAVLGGVLGALLAGRAADAEAAGATLTAEDLAPVAAAAAVLHAEAGRSASAGGPIAALDIAEHLPGVVAALLR